MVKFKSVTLRFDGSCQPNPGKGGGGYVIMNDDDESIIMEGYFPVRPDCTNNVAEYFGLFKGLKALKNSKHTAEHLNIEGDSDLVIKQMRKEYKVRKNRIFRIMKMSESMVSKLTRGDYYNNHSFRHIERKSNAEADALARKAVEADEPWINDHYE